MENIEGMKIKFIPLIFLSFIILFGAIFFCCQKEVDSKEYEYLRIHINANSCEDIDQNIKYDIRDKIINFLSYSIFALAFISPLSDSL